MQLCKKKICNKAVEKNPMMIRFVPNHFKTQEICERSSCKRFSYALPYVPDEYKTQQMYKSVVLKYPENLRFLLNQYKTQEMSELLKGSHIIAIYLYVRDRYKTTNRCMKKSF